MPTRRWARVRKKLCLRSCVQPDTLGRARADLKTILSTLQWACILYTLPSTYRWRSWWFSPENIPHFLANIQYLLTSSSSLCEHHSSQGLELTQQNSYDQEWSLTYCLLESFCLSLLLTLQLFFFPQGQGDHWGTVPSDPTTGTLHWW